MTVEDEISQDMLATARYFLSPGLKMNPVGPDSWWVTDCDVPLAKVAVELGHGCVERVRQAQRFGVIEEVDCLTVQLVSGAARTTWTWERHAHIVSSR